MSKRKSYNPFKMWGSYVGLLLYPILIQIGIQSTSFLKYINVVLFMPFRPFMWLYCEVLNKGMADCGMAVGIMMIIFVAPILGFLVGWAIHSWIRKIKR